MTAAEKIQRVLTDPASRNINFSYDGNRVYGVGFERMARKVEHGHISVRLVRFQRAARAMMRAGGAVYNKDSNTIFIPRPDFPIMNSVHDRALVIHEMTHALCDYHAVTISRKSSEATAYVAQMMYAFSAGVDDASKLAVFSEPFPPELRGIFEVAWGIAHTIRTPPLEYSVSDSDVEALNPTDRRQFLLRKDGGRRHGIQRGSWRDLAAL